MRQTAVARLSCAGQRGAVMPMIGLIIIALLALAALAVDIGYILVTRQQLQNTADACVYAAAPGMVLEEPAKTEAVLASVVSMAARQKAGNDESVTIVPSEDVVIDGNRVTVHARKLKSRENGLPLFFAKILGIRHADVVAKAILEVFPTTSACCVKPWAIPDLWNDQTPIAGYPTWANNGRWNGEEFTDSNGNRLWDPGETFKDENGNDVYDSEHYDRARSIANLEGFIPEIPPAGNIGMQLNLKLSSKMDRPAPSFFNPVVLPWPEDMDIAKRGANPYEESIKQCNPTMIVAGQELLLESEPGRMVGPTNHGTKYIIEQDPDAFWNEELYTVDHRDGGSLGDSPRIILIPVYDPRIWPGTGRLKGEDRIVISKIVAFFIEDLKKDVVIGRVCRAPISCMDSTTPGGNSGFTWSCRLVE
ncbi:MAG: Tad domain-containing protein [Candidatus Eisenbacteria bacterium]